MKTWITLACCLFSTLSLFAQKLPVSKTAAESLLRPRQIVKITPPLRYLPSAAVTQGFRFPVKGPGEKRAVLSSRQIVPPQKEAPAAVLSASEKARMERVLAQRLAPVKMPLPLVETEKHIRQSLVQIIGPATGELMGSGFVVRSGSGKLYAVVSYHVVGHAGNKVAVRMYDKLDREITYRGVVNATGSYGLNAPDAAIIALPSEAAKHARPLKVAADFPQKGEELVVWGTPYAVNGFARADELLVKHVQGFKIVMDSPDVSTDFNGLCGSPVLNREGKVVGIYSGHDPDRGLVFAVPARKALEWMIGNYEQGFLASFSLRLAGREILRLVPGETVGWVRHFSPDGTLLHKVYLPQYPEPFDPAHVETLFPDVHSGDFLEFEVVRHRFLDRMVSVEIS